MTANSLTRLSVPDREIFRTPKMSAGRFGFLTSRENIGWPRPRYTVRGKPRRGSPNRRPRGSPRRAPDDTEAPGDCLYVPLLARGGDRGALNLRLRDLQQPGRRGPNLKA